MRTDFTTLKLFIAAAEYRNIAKAAEACSIVPSAVSKRIAALEDSIGVPLFFRKSRGVELTQAGEVALKYAKSIFKLIERFEGEMSEYTEGIQGHIRIAACPSSIVQFLPADIAEYVEKNTLVKIDLIEVVTESIISMVRDGLVDIGITSGLMQVDDLDFLPYQSDKLSVLAPRSHPLSVFDSMRFEETLSYNYVGLQEGSSIRNMLCQKARKLNKDINFSVSVMSFSGVINMVEAGLGITIIPEGTIPKNMCKDLKIIKLNESWSSRTLELVTREEAALPVVSKNLFNYLSDINNTK